MGTVLAFCLVMVGAPPEAGMVAPDFQAHDTEGKVVHLEALVKDGPVVVAFFPKAFTST